MSSVNDILNDHAKQPKSAGTPSATRSEATKQVNQLAKDLAAEGTIRSETAPPTPARGRGRPRSNSGSKTPPQSRSKSPRTPEVPLPDQFPQTNKPPEDPDVVANRMKCRKMIRKLRAYRRNFPELLAGDLDCVNVHACSYEQLCNLVESCKEVIGDEVEAMSVGNVPGELLQGAENLALRYAATSDSEIARKLLHLRNFAQVAKQDPCIAMDMKLIACEWTGIMPQNPYLRLALNLGRCAIEVMQENSSREATNQAASQQRFSDL